MAALNTSSSSSSGDRGVEDLVECPICYAPFDRPLQLSCGHTLCGNCVDKLVEGSRQAPHHNLMMEFGDEELQRLMNPFGDRVFRAAVGAENQQGLGGAQEAAAQVPPVQIQPPHPLHHRFRANFGWDAPYDPVPPPVNAMNRIMGRRMYLGGGGNAGDGRGTTIKCPECRAPTTVPAAGLPVNYRLQDMIARLNAQSAITGKKVTAKVEVIKCERCEESLANGCYYTCKNPECENDGRSKQLCATCGIRYHNGHRIDENRVLTDRDVAEAKESIGLHMARATQAMEQLTQKINLLSVDATQNFSDRMAESMKVFDSLASSMDGLLFHSVDALVEIQRKADAVASKYEEMNLLVQDFVEANKRQFENFDRQMADFLREMGLNMRAVTVKQEPMSEDDVIVLENDAMDLRRNVDLGPGPSTSRAIARARDRHEAKRQAHLARQRLEHRMTRELNRHVAESGRRAAAALAAATGDGEQRMERSRSPSPEIGGVGGEVLRLMREGTDTERVVGPVTERAARATEYFQMTLSARRRLEQQAEGDALMRGDSPPPATRRRVNFDENIERVLIPHSPEQRELRRRYNRGRARPEVPDMPRRKTRCSRRNAALEEHNVFPAEPTTPPPPIPNEPQGPPRSPSPETPPTPRFFDDASAGSSSSSNDAPPNAPGPSGM